MKEPVRLPPPTSPRIDSPPRSKPQSTGRARNAALTVASERPRGRVPGGKALARLNMFLLQRGLGPEPSAPPPPVLPTRGRATATGGAAPGPGAASAPQDLVAAFRATRRQLAAQPAAAVPQTWQPLGPFFVPHGQTYGGGPGSRPPVAGRVSSVAVDPGNPDHILCGSAGGGVWETRDRGRSWVPTTDDQPSLAIGTLAFDPTDPRRVYAGTGEGDTAPSASTNIRAAGLLVSDDGGATWTVQAGGTFVGVSFHGIVVDRSDGTHLLAATTNGLYESRDRGTTWAQRIPKLTWSVSLHPPVPTNPASGSEALAGRIDGVFRSTDGGTSWTKVALPGAPAGFQPERIAVCHAPGNGSVAYVVAAGPPEVQDPLGEPGDKMPKPYLWRRSAFGGPFTAVDAPPDLQTGQSWYDWFAAVAPNNPEVLFVGGINAHRGVRQGNGSWSWTNISAKTPSGDSIHPDQHAITFSPEDPNVVYIGNDGGLYRSPDGGTTWDTLNKGLCITEVEFLAQHPEFDAWLLAGTQDNGTIRYEGQQTWYSVQDGDGGDCGVDTTEPRTCYHSFYGAYLEKSSAGGGWKEWQPTTPRALNNERSLFYPPLDVSGKLVVRGATRVWLSPDAGASWKPTALPGQTGFPSALAANSDLTYVGTATGELYRLDRTGANWTATPLTSPAAGGYVSDLLANPTNPNELWCSANVTGVGGIHLSTDGGTTWTPRRAGLPPNMAVHAIEIDPTATSRLFAATDVGVFRTDDGGASWTAFGRGLPNVLVKDLVLHPQARLLRAGTQARGVWEIAVDGATMPDVYVYLRDHAADTGRRLPSPVDLPNPFSPGTNLFWWQSPDIKVDASPFRVPGLDELDFDVYSDDHSKEDEGIEFASGLFDERPTRGQTVRIYVQVHNRGSKSARNVAVRLFYAPGSLTWPELPAGFWTDFPDNSVPASSEWQPVAAHRVIAEVATGRSMVVGFDWSVPTTIGSAVGLLAVVSADNDSFSTTTLDVADLVRSSRYCSLRNLAVVNPAPMVGPRSPAVLVDVWPADAPLSLELDRQARSLVDAVVVSKALAPAAKKAGWREVKIGKAQAAQLAYISDARPELRRQIDLGKAYRPSAVPLDLARLPSQTEAQPFLLVMKARAKRGAGSLLVRRGQDLRGGMTIINLAQA